MEKDKRGIKKQFKVNIRPIISLLIGLVFFSAILLVTMLEVPGNNKPAAKNLNASEDGLQGNVQAAQGTSAQNYDSEIIAVVTGIDTEGKTVNLFDISKEETMQLKYNGGCNILDKYGQPITISQISLGTMVDAGYLKDLGKLMKMQKSTKAWEYIGVNNLSIDRYANIMKIASTKYKYTDNIVVIDGNSQVPVENLAEQDELTIRGYEETIWSVTVTRGHGTVKLEDYEDYIGANITIGYEATQQISEDMVIPVREGNFNLTVENGKFSATKNITVYRNQETSVSLSDIGPKAEKKGLIDFEISPFGADLFIDGELNSYANPIELAYGNHVIEVSLGGYTTYKGSLEVKDAGETIRINLPEASSGEDAVVTVNQGTTGTDNSNTTGTDNSNTTGTDNSNTAGSGNTDTSGAGNTDTSGNDSDNSTDNSSEGQDNNANDGTDTSDNSSSDETGNDDTTVDKEHNIIVQNPIGASVYLNGEFMGVSPLNIEKIIGTHVITFIKDGYETKSYTVEVPDNGMDIYFSFEDLNKQK